MHLPWTFLFIGSMLSLSLQSNPDPAPDQPQMRDDANSRIAHEQLCRKASQGTIDVYFVGDSITRRWGATDYPELLAQWQKSFFGWNAANFGWGGDRTQNILWRLRNGELEGVRPKVFVVLAGTNNLTAQTDPQAAQAIANGIIEIVHTCRRTAPEATVVLMAIFPRGDLPHAGRHIEQINQQLARFADGEKVRFLSINDQLVDNHGEPKSDYFPDRLHPSLPAYQIWADALRPFLLQRLGPPASTDHAPPPTGDPKAAPR